MHVDVLAGRIVFFTSAAPLAGNRLYAAGNPFLISRNHRITYTRSRGPGLNGTSLAIIQRRTFELRLRTGITPGFKRIL